MVDVGREPQRARGQLVSLSDRGRSARRDGFVGRAGPRRLLGRALRGEPRVPQVFLLHGIPGIGKSALLQQVTDDAHQLGRAVVRVDGQRAGRSVAVFEALARPARSAGRALLVVDRFEHCRTLETWLREDFLPALPGDTVVVLAGRLPPQPHWTADPGWHGLVHTLRLDALDPAETSVFLAARAVPADRRAAVRGFAGGHPLALGLAAASACDHRPDGPAGAGWSPGPQLVRTLLGHLVEPPPSAAHEYGLRVAGLARHVTLDLLRTGLDAEPASAVFDWLSGLPGVTPGRPGLRLADLPRHLIRADARWRAPQEYARLRSELWRALGRRVRVAPDDSVTESVTELLSLLGTGAPGRSEPGPDAVLTECPYTPDRRSALLHLAGRRLGEEQTRLVAHWVDRRPAAFTLWCRAEDPEPVAFLAWLRLRPGDAGDDPALGPVRRHLDELGPDDHVGVARFVVPARGGPGTAALVARLCADHLRGPVGLVASYLLLPGPGPAGETLRRFGFSARPGRAGDELFVRDWRAEFPAAYLERFPELPGPRPDDRGPARPGLSPLAHHEAVRRALRDWHDDDAVAANPLARFHGDGAALRQVVRDAVDALGADPGRPKLQRAVHATYLDRPTSQEAAAARLGIPFSTYRRHLKAGVQLLNQQLWARHLEALGSARQRA